MRSFFSTVLTRYKEDGVPLSFGNTLKLHVSDDPVGKHPIFQGKTVVFISPQATEDQLERYFSQFIKE